MIAWGSYRAGLRPDFAQWCDDCIGPLPDVWPVTAGLRTMAVQAALYAQGRTRPGQIVTYAEPGDSAHNVGLAIDVALQPTPGALSWDYTLPQWQSLWMAVRASAHLHSGMDFPVGETDPPHVERLNWREFITPRPTHHRARHDGGGAQGALQGRVWERLGTDIVNRGANAKRA